MPAGPFGEAVRNFDLAVLEQWNSITSELIDSLLTCFQRVALGPCQATDVFDLRRPSVKLKLGPKHTVDISGILDIHNSATIQPHLHDETCRQALG